MKKFLKFSLVFALVLTAIGAHASDVDFSLNVKKGKGKTVSFALNQVKKIDLSIYDANDKLIHTETVNSKGNINRTYDLEALPNGTYFLEAETAMKIARYTITVVDETASLSTEVLTEVFKPVFVNKDGKVGLNILNLDKSPVGIKIFDADANEVYNTTLLDTQNVNKFFDITTFPSENYTFEMSYDNKVFFKTIALK